MRTPFQRDRDRIVHSKPFRRLKGKTQVFIDPDGDHYRTRMTHTLETTAISRVVARALRLNEDLVEAIGLGHDMGHTPFGHAGEDALDDALRERFGRRFRHNEQSLRIARSLNLTHEVCDGILTHTGEQEPATLEGKIVRLVDRVAYINHDIDDALRYGLLDEDDLPADEIAVLGATGSARIDRLVHDIVESSDGVGEIRQSAEVAEAMLSLRAFMFERVYLGPQAAPEHERAHEVVRAIFDHLAERGDEAGRDRRLHRGHDRPLRADLRRVALSARERGLDLGDEGRRVDRAVEGERALELVLRLVGPARGQQPKACVPADVRLDRRVAGSRHHVCRAGELAVQREHDRRPPEGDGRTGADCTRRSQVVRRVERICVEPEPDQRAVHPGLAHQLDGLADQGTSLLEPPELRVGRRRARDASEAMEEVEPRLRELERPQLVAKRAVAIAT